MTVPNSVPTTGKNCVLQADHALEMMTEDAKFALGF